MLLWLVPLANRAILHRPALVRWYNCMCQSTSSLSTSYKSYKTFVFWKFHNLMKSHTWLHKCLYMPMKRVKELYYDNLQTLFLNCYLSLTWYYSIFSQMVFDICFEVDTLPSIFCDSPTIRLRLQRFAIRLDNESQSGTPLCRYLVPCDTRRCWCQL